MPGFNEYTGKGPSCTIDQVESFVPGKKIGVQLINHLKAQDFELIDLEAEGDQRQHYFERQGFKDTTLTNDRYRIMAWNNPTYQN